YRAATAAALRREPNPERWTVTGVVDAAAQVTVAARGKVFVPLIVGADAADEIRGPEVTRQVSRVAQMPAVRAWVNDRVRALAQDYDVVVDGRDIGTVVLPDAALKVFLVADPWERAKRRLLERQGAGGGRGARR